MRSFIVTWVAQGILPITTIFALHLLLRGHDMPGGGFIAGLVTTSAFVLQAVAFGLGWARARLARVVGAAIAAGLLLALAAGLLGPLLGSPFLTHFTTALRLPGGLNVGIATTLAFDVGVYFVVIGAVSRILAVFAERA